MGPGYAPGRACVRAREGGDSRGPVAMCSGCKTRVLPGALLLARLPRVGRIAPPPSPSPSPHPVWLPPFISPPIFLSPFSFVITLWFSPFLPKPSNLGWKSSIAFLFFRSSVWCYIYFDCWTTTFIVCLFLAPNPVLRPNTLETLTAVYTSCTRADTRRNAHAHQTADVRFAIPAWRVGVNDVELRCQWKGQSWGICLMS